MNTLAGFMTIKCVIVYESRKGLCYDLPNILAGQARRNVVQPPFPEPVQQPIHDPATSAPGGHLVCVALKNSSQAKRVFLPA